MKPFIVKCEKNNSTKEFVVIDTNWDTAEEGQIWFMGIYKGYPNFCQINASKYECKFIRFCKEDEVDFPTE